MTPFKTRIAKISREKGCLILANDYDSSIKQLESKTIKNIKTLHKHICGLKLNFHLLLPLGEKEITKINKIAHQYNIQTIADIKLNDIGNTNKVTIERLWDLGFDSVIINPIMGVDSIRNIVTSAHKKSKGVITLCHMSAPEARKSYELDLEIKKKKIKLYQLFLEWAISQKVDGIIVGATFPNIIKQCKTKSKGKISIYSPGVGTQGGTVQDSIKNGSNFLIVGRTILNSKNPVKTIENLKLQSLLK